MTEDKHPNDMTREELIDFVNHLRWMALDLAQDLCFQFEFLSIDKVKPEFREDHIQSMQDAGLSAMQSAYGLAGFSPKKRQAIQGNVQELLATGHTIMNNDF